MMNTIGNENYQVSDIMICAMARLIHNGEDRKSVV